MHRFGGPEVLACEEVPTPEPGPGDVLVRVATVSVNRTLDLAVRAGTYHIRPSLPHILGTDPAGTVAAVGPDVTERSVGQRVAVLTATRCGQCQFCRSGREADCPNTRHVGVGRWGGYAEAVCVPWAATVLLPDDLPFEEGTVLVRHFPTALHLLEETAEIQAGEWLLVMGAAGALGSCLVQAGRLLGARVIAAAGSDERVASCLSNGAEFAVNYRTKDLAAEVMRITGGHGADVVAENIADPTLWPGAFNSLAFRGRLVTAGAHGGGKVELDVRRLYLRRLRVIGSPGSTERALRRTLELAAEGRLRAVIGKRMPLCDAAEAHRLVAENAVIGKVILELPASGPAEGTRRAEAGTAVSSRGR